MTRPGILLAALVLLGGIGNVLCTGPAAAEEPAEIVVLVLPFGMGAAPEVLWCESRGDWHARNGDQWGGWQLHRPSHEGKAQAHGWTWEEACEDPAKQTAIAVEVWQASGWAPWGACQP